MRKTLDDLLRDWTEQPLPRRTLWRALRGRLWLEHAISVSGREWPEFERIFIQRNRSASKLGAKWRAGTTLPNRSSALAMERVLPGTAWVFELPLFRLLSDEPITRSQLMTLTARYRDTGLLGEPVWKLPYGADLAIYYDSKALLYRGDLWGLVALVASLRWAELDRDDYQHLESSQDAFRALPALLRVSWIATSVPMIFELLQRVRRRMPYTKEAHEVDWKRIQSLAALESFSADPAGRPTNSLGYAEPYPDPIVLMKRVADRRMREW